VVGSRNSKRLETLIPYDPVHVALPWAGVRFALQVMVNDHQSFGMMAEGLEMVSNLIVRCRVWEELYLTKTSTTMNAQFTHALLKLYKEILVFLGGAGKYYKQSTRLVKIGCWASIILQLITRCIFGSFLTHI
jgi:hypothetical protein